MGEKRSKTSKIILSAGIACGAVWLIALAYVISSRGLLYSNRDQTYLEQEQKISLKLLGIQREEKNSRTNAREQTILDEQIIELTESLAINYWTQKEYLNSEKLFAHALELENKLPFKFRSQRTLNLMAGMYRDWHKLEQAQKLYQDILAFDFVENKPGSDTNFLQARDLNNLGTNNLVWAGACKSLALRQKHLKDAKTFFETAMNLLSACTKNGKQVEAVSADRAQLKILLQENYDLVLAELKQEG
jgi:hypothetical protein